MVSLTICMLLSLAQTAADWDPFDDDKLSESLETIGDLSR